MEWGSNLFQNSKEASTILRDKWSQDDCSPYLMGKFGLFVETNLLIKTKHIGIGVREFDRFQKITHHKDHFSNHIIAKKFLRINRPFIFL